MLFGTNRWDKGAREYYGTVGENSDSFLLFDDHIELRDWLGYVYKLDYQGNVIHEV